jgi:putative acetyltransferase
VAAFVPAHRLYESAGFMRTGPFGAYAEDPNSIFMTLVLAPLPPTARAAGG